jgi:hypothetical protein
MVRMSTVVKRFALVAATTVAVAFTAPSFAADIVMPEVRFQHGSFEPAHLTVPANTPFKVKVINGSDAAIEFESFELHRERVVPPGEAITVHMPSLAPGSYQFFDDFNHLVPNGVIVSE